VIFGGVDLGQFLPECVLPECQFLVVQIGWRVDDDLQHPAVVRHDGHGFTTKIVEGAAKTATLRRAAPCRLGMRRCARARVRWPRYGRDLFTAQAAAQYR
jgi:hypothetical protein